IVKNAVESIEARIAESGPSPPGQILITVEARGQVAVAVEDNGKGLPAQGRERLTEPYVTTRAKGTGLGLAIVKKIMEDHHGELKDEGYATREAADSSQALAAIQGRQPTLVILDIWLQGSELDGIDILRQLQAEMPSVPVVIISGHGTIESAVEAIKIGAYDF